MAGETPITIIGNMTGDPELRFTNSGMAVASFTVASTPRTFNRQTNQWEDGTAMFLRCSAWRSLAENCAETLKKGMRVIVTGRLVQNNWQNNQGENRSSIEVQVDEIGPSLRYATAQVQRNDSGSSGGFNQGRGGYNQGGYNQSQQFGSGGQSGFSAPPAGPGDDQWSSTNTGNQPSAYDGEPPF